MKLCMFSPRGMDLERGWPGRIDGDTIVQLAAQTLQAFFTGGGAAREHARYPLEECDLRAPVLYPPAVRVFGPVEPGRAPFFSFRSPFPILGPEQELPCPEGVGELAPRPGLAAVVGLGGQIGGFTLANDWTARDLAAAEREAGHGPSKSSDFGLSLGPVVVTPDELDVDRITVSVNGEQRYEADVRALSAAWPDLVAHAARNTALRPGDVLVAAAAGAVSAVQPGDVVELEAVGIGVLRSRLAA